MSVRSRAFTAIIIASVLWGSAGVVAKILLQELSPFVINFYRYLLASLVILPFFLKEKKKKISWLLLILISTLTAFNVNLFYIGLRTTTANSAYLIGASVPLLTVFFSRVLINEEVSRRKLLGIFVGLFGALIVVILPAIELGQSLSGDLVGNVFVGSGAVLWTLYVIISRRFISTDKTSPLVFTTFNFFTTTAVSFIFAVMMNQRFFSPKIIHPTYLIILFYTAIMVTVVTYLLFNYAIKHIFATTASLKEYLQLFFGLLLNTLLLGEKITAGLLMGGILIVGGVAIATGTKMLSAVRKKIFLKP